LVVFVLSGTVLWAGGGGDRGAPGQVTIEIVQWWQPEMRAGSFERVISDFEAKHPNIRVRSINLPFAEVLNQITVGNAAGTLSDVMGVNPPWLSDFIRQGIVEPLDEYIARDRFNLDDLASQLVIDNRQWIFPIAIFLQAVYYNVDHFREANLFNTPGD
jgi:multiple sugar transport system substrate-binding protein